MKEYLSEEQIKLIWGEEFLRFIDNERVHFTDDKIIVTLQYPISYKVDGNKIDVNQLEIDQPDTSGMKLTDRHSTEEVVHRSVTLLKSCANEGKIPMTTIDKIKLRDLGLLVKIMTIFLAEFL